LQCQHFEGASGAGVKHNGETRHYKSVYTKSEKAFNLSLLSFKRILAENYFQNIPTSKIFPNGI
jgi:hypothetical protein